MNREKASFLPVHSFFKNSSRFRKNLRYSVFQCADAVDDDADFVALT